LAWLTLRASRNPPRRWGPGVIVKSERPSAAACSMVVLPASSCNFSIIALCLIAGLSAAQATTTTASKEFRSTASYELGNDPTAPSTTDTTTTATSIFKCQPAEVAWQPYDLLHYATCVRDNCEEMSGSVLSKASQGSITGCFLLLEAAGGCSSNASKQVFALEALNESFQVGDLCGELCSRCEPDLPDVRRPSQSAQTSTSEIHQWPAEATESESDTRVAGTVPDGKQRVLLGQLYFRVKSAATFAVQPGLMKACRDGLAAAMLISPSKVFILDIRALDGQGTESQPSSGATRLRRIDSNADMEVSQTVAVGYEIIDAPQRLDAAQVTNEMTATSVQEHVEQLLASESGVQSDISGVNLEAPEEELRESFTSTSGLASLEEILSVTEERSTSDAVQVDGCGRPSFGLAGYLLAPLVTVWLSRVTN